MATSERLQMQKLREGSANEEQFALVLFEEEGRYSVVGIHRIKEAHYAYNQHVNVLWGKGSQAKYFKAKLIMCGLKEDCEKESLDLSLTLDSNVGDCTESENPSPTIKRKMDDHDGKAGQAKKKTKGVEKSRSAEASWQASIDDEQRRLNLVVEKWANTKEPLQRSHSPLYDAEVEQHHDSSHILSRLDRIEAKLDSLIRQSRKSFSTCTSVSPASSRSETPIPVFTKEIKRGTGGAINVGSDDEDDDGSVDADFVFNGIDLLALKAPPKEPTRYATKLAGLLFSKEELLQGMVDPINEKFARTALDPERITIIRKCIVKRYSEKILTKHWAEIRRAINQKCNDLRKKQTVSVA